ncbi:MAG TPA: ABC transporter ATP-binding protein [Candidatus Hydrogenedentes bacterium]|nr:ABC transporter ATP-binding protein [Candidatus Hydrogenedentota bacterium]
MPLLEVKDLRTWFHTRDGIIRAVDGVSFSLDRGETLGVVGESGCGKSVTFYSMLGLLPMPPAKIESGTAMFDGVDLLTADAATLRGIRGRRISMVFQDPMTALNPYMRIGSQVMEPLLAHGLCDRREARRRAAAMLEAAGIQDASARMRDYPHVFSGGMRQRAVIAMALVSQPDILIADEPTTALDVTVQAQILALMAKLRDELGMAMVLITHDLGVIAGVCDRVLVMYAGRILEEAPTAMLYRNPQHPYTRALMDSLPGIQEAGKPLNVIPGLPPEQGAPEQGCPFAPRCPVAIPECNDAACPLLSVGGEDHRTACIRVHRGELGERL